jgi:hypothetical protein
MQLSAAEPKRKVTALRTPHGGIQPQTAVDREGTVHLLYFLGDAHRGDLYYVRSKDGTTFSDPIAVNSQPGSAIAVGNIRGAHLAVGKKGRVHVAWMGADKVAPRAPGDSTPMLYTRINDDGTTFEPQRNIIQSAVGLDGGGSVCADDAGNVYVAWHAPAPGTKGEENRRVWLARSADDGRTFGAEQAVSPSGTGACGCCGMRAYCDREGSVYLLYRSAGEKVNRDSYLLVSRDQGKSFQAENLSKWKVNICPMSSYSLAESGESVVAAWETNGQVFFARVDRGSVRHADPTEAPGVGRGRKYPVVAGNAHGETILVWTDGVGWNRGGGLAWQVFGKDGRPSIERGKAPGVPVWSLVTVFPRRDGGFSIIY